METDPVNPPVLDCRVWSVTCPACMKRSQVLLMPPFCEHCGAHLRPNDVKAGSWMKVEPPVDCSADSLGRPLEGLCLIYHPPRGIGHGPNNCPDCGKPMRAHTHDEVNEIVHVICPDHWLETAQGRVQVNTAKPLLP